MAAILLLLLVGFAVRASPQSRQILALARESIKAHSTGNLLLEQLLLRRLVIASSGDLSEAASHRLAESSLESGDYSETVRLLSYGDGTADESSLQIRRDRALLGEAYRRSGDTATAIPILNAVFDETMNRDQPDDGALMSVKSLDLIGGDLTEADHFRRGGVYQFNRYWAEARSHYQQVQTTPDAAEALFQTGRGYSQDANYAEAIPYFQRVIDHFPDAPQARDSLLQIASAYSRTGRTDEAISRYQSFIDKYPTAERLDRAYLNIVDVYRDLGDDAHALEWCRNTEMAFAGRLPESLAIFDEAKIYAAAHKHDMVIDALDRLQNLRDLGGASVPGGTTSDEVLSMRVHALAPGRDDSPSQEWIDSTNTLGIERLRSPIIGTKSDYPVPFSDIIVRRAAATSVDPRLLFAIMRQESKFDPQARSNAPARGLMQFTHPQALKIAKELGWTYFSDDELYSPENSIALSVRYLADLNAMFPEETEAIVASYNGGEDNVKRWIARSRSSEPEDFVPEIVYGQTKDYVQKVIANYRVYCRLYDRQLKPK